MKYKFVLFSKQPWMHKTAKHRDIIRNEEYGWNSLSFSWGKRDSDINQLFPFYYWKNNGSINFGLGFLKIYFGLTYTIKGEKENRFLSQIFGRHINFIR
jgi:hypothetical protein